MTAVQLADGVWRVPTAPADLVNSYLLADADGSLTLVDAGLKNAHKKVLAALAQLGKAPQDVQRILMTHAHADHAGGLAGAQKATGARVLSHQVEAPYLMAGEGPPRESGLGRLLDRLPGSGFAAVDVDESFADGAVLPIAGGLTVVHTPGHSPGHCSFLHRPTGVLITGDAIFNVRGLRYSPKTFCTDIRLSRDTAGRLGELEFDVAAFTHGSHVSTGARAAVRAFLAGRPS
jgi:glyoxylase-like metal-dependent hydrolase (beta-lactamase superfamily II)